ncbi:hypothetical protein AVEN_70547-1 [Araneus ventricosus]|uniref:Uncharacterized protein n=1 Tax=Araneus ventricosus TaxID=182803 RepID=A0A4Y2KC46_ARAVE|nr:hypothetical protein AVEN_21392-1 [Araneus ventricosus]GBM98967.1 hypothetical protein AVEN_70547-1 [Araneus ventricosus]
MFAAVVRFPCTTKHTACHIEEVSEKHKGRPSSLVPISPPKAECLSEVKTNYDSSLTGIKAAKITSEFPLAKRFFGCFFVIFSTASKAEDIYSVLESRTQGSWRC